MELSLNDKRIMRYMGDTVRCYYKRKDNGAPFHRDYATMEAMQKSHKQVKECGKVDILGWKEV